MLYVEYWFRCPNAVEVPCNDILFFTRLDGHKLDDKQVAEITIKNVICESFMILLRGRSYIVFVI